MSGGVKKQRLEPVRLHAGESNNEVAGTGIAKVHARARQAGSTHPRFRSKLLHVNLLVLYAVTLLTTNTRTRMRIVNRVAYRTRHQTHQSAHVYVARFTDPGLLSELDHTCLLALDAVMSVALDTRSRMRLVVRSSALHTRQFVARRRQGHLHDAVALIFQIFARLTHPLLPTELDHALLLARGAMKPFALNACPRVSVVLATALDARVVLRDALLSHLARGISLTVVQMCTDLTDPSLLLELAHVLLLALDAVPS